MIDNKNRQFLLKRMIDNKKRHFLLKTNNASNLTKFVWLLWFLEHPCKRWCFGWKWYQDKDLEEVSDIDYKNRFCAIYEWITIDLSSAFNGTPHWFPIFAPFQCKGDQLGTRSFCRQFWKVKLWEVARTSSCHWHKMVLAISKCAEWELATSIQSKLCNFVECGIWMPLPLHFPSCSIVMFLPVLQAS